MFRSHIDKIAMRKHLPDWFYIRLNTGKLFLKNKCIREHQSRKFGGRFSPTVFKREL
jgi:hypothetical protein